MRPSLDPRAHPLEQAGGGVNVAGAIVQDLPALRSRPRTAGDDQIAHRGLVLSAHRINTEVGAGAEQGIARRGRQAVGLNPELGE